MFCLEPDVAPSPNPSADGVKTSGIASPKKLQHYVAFLHTKSSWRKFIQHNMHRVSHLIQQLFVRVIIHVANNLPLLQLVLVKVVPGLKMSANCQDRYHPAHLLHNGVSISSFFSFSSSISSSFSFSSSSMSSTNVAGHHLLSTMSIKWNNEIVKLIHTVSYSDYLVWWGFACLYYSPHIIHACKDFFIGHTPRMLSWWWASPPAWTSPTPPSRAPPLPTLQLAAD